MFLISSCLVGFPCRYDAAIKKPEDLFAADVVRIFRRYGIPVCPEVLGELGTPRPPAEIQSGTGFSVLRGSSRIINVEGRDVTEQYMSGAQKAMQTGLQAGCRTAILKARSPACGYGSIYDGTFTSTLKSGSGVFAALLKSQGFQIYTEEQIAALLPKLDMPQRKAILGL